MIVRCSRAALAILFMASVPAAAEPVENGSEVAALLSALDGRCWAVDLDGEILDADAMAQIEGPVDIDLECVLSEVKPAVAGDQRPQPLPANVI